MGLSTNVRGERDDDYILQQLMCHGKAEQAGGMEEDRDT